MHEYPPISPIREHDTSGSTDDDDNYHYDVYLFYPSASSRLYLASASEIGDIEALEEPGWYLIDQVHRVSTISPPPSLTYTSTIETVFPQYDEIQERSRGFAGYSRLFLSGFLSRSRQITRRLDAVSLKVQVGLERAKQKLFGH